MITYLKGSAVEPVTTDVRVIAHICNDIGAWGRGFVLSVSQKYPIAEADYRNWHQGNSPIIHGDPPYPKFELGAVRCVKVDENVWVANMIAQHGIFAKNGVSPIRYDALEQCLRWLTYLGFGSVHMPRIGCGLAGGKWSEVEPIIERALTDKDVYVYDFDSKDSRTVAWMP